MLHVHSAAAACLKTCRFASDVNVQQDEPSPGLTRAALLT